MESYEQMGLESINTEPSTAATKLFSKIFNLFKNVYDDSENLKLVNNKAYSTICFFNVPKLRIKIIKKVPCLEIPEHFEDLIQENLINCRIMSDRYRRIEVPNFFINNVLKTLLLDIYEYCLRKYSDERFDCCSKYMECSDNKKCSYEKDKFGRACSYRYTMSEKGGGKIFYGKNRNIK